jgi:hypothetical protein
MRPRTWKHKLPLLLAAFAVLLGIAVAQAEPIQQFSFEVTNIKSGGRFTLLFNSHTFDTTGAVPPPITSNYFRIPAGATIPKVFRNKTWWCNGQALRSALDNRPNGQGFADRVANLKPFIRSLSKSRDRSDRAALALAQTCERARIGGGTVMVDARNYKVAVLKDLVRGKFSMFFAKPTVPGGVAGFVVMGAADTSVPIVKANPVIAGVHVALNSNFVNDPSPDGLYGYKLLLPTGPINGIDVSLAEIHAKISGLTLLKGTCLARNHRGRCMRKQKKTVFWFTQPKCPASGLISFQAFFGYAPPTPSITQTKTLTCPKFS